jgi:hypothetical protein
VVLEMDISQDLESLKEIERTKYLIRQELNLNTKSPFFGFFLSLIIPGLGQIYAKAYLKGFLFFSFFLALASLNFGIKKLFLNIDSPLVISSFIVHFILWITILFDAQKSVKYYNLGKEGEFSREIMIILIVLEVFIISVLNILKILLRG